MRSLQQGKTNRTVYLYVFRLYRESSAIRHSLDGIHGKVIKNLPDLGLVHSNGPEVVLDIEGHQNRGPSSFLLYGFPENSRNITHLLNGKTPAGEGNKTTGKVLRLLGRLQGVL